MSTRTWTVLAAVFACLGLVGPAGAVTYRSVQSGNWFTMSTWEIPDPSHSGKWMTPSCPASCGDCVEVRHAVVLDGDALVTGAIIDAGASLSIGQADSLTLCGSSPFVVAAGSLAVEGLLTLSSDSGTPYLEIQGSHKLPSPGGEIRALASSAGTPQIRINAAGGNAGMTNLGTVDGLMVIIGTNNGSHSAIFDNQGVVSANQSGSVLLDSSLDAVYDLSSSLWKVEVSASAILQFDQPCTLSGTVQMLVSGGRLNINDSVSVGALVYNYGRITVASSETFCFSSVSGTCGTLPTSCVTGIFWPCP